MNNIINNNINSSIMSFFDMIANHPAQPLVLDAIFVIVGIIIMMSILDDMIPFAFDVYENVIEPRLRLMWNNNNNNNNNNSHSNSNSNSHGNGNSNIGSNSNSIVINRNNNHSRRRASEDEPLEEEDTSYYYLPPQLLLQTINSGVDTLRRREGRSAQSEGVVARDQGRPPIYPRRRRHRRSSRRRTSNRTTNTNTDNNTNEDRIEEEEDVSTPTLPVLSEEGLAPPVDTSTVATSFSDFVSHGGEDEGDKNSNTNTGAKEEIGDVDVNNTTASFSFAWPSDFGPSLSNSGGSSGVGNEDASLTYSEGSDNEELDFDLDILDDSTNPSSTQQPEEPAVIIVSLANEDLDVVERHPEPILPEESNELFGVPLSPVQVEEVVVVEDLPQEQLLSEVEAEDDGTAAAMELFVVAGECNHMEAVAKEEEEVPEEDAQALVDEGGDEEATNTVMLGSIWVKHPKYTGMVRRSSRLMLMSVM
jgi:hypothetical protein